MKIKGFAVNIVCFVVGTSDSPESVVLSSNHTTLPSGILVAETTSLAVYRVPSGSSASSLAFLKDRITVTGAT